MNHSYHDIIIIGAGLAGLYSAYNIKKMSPNTNLLVLESNRRPYIGGRIGNQLFYGQQIVVGAGVGRKDTDKLLIELLDELRIKYASFTVSMRYAKTIDNPVNVKDILLLLREKYRKTKSRTSITFKQFATKHLGENLYNDFVISAGYSDYENEDVFEVLYHYQMDDNAPGWTALNIPWSKLVNSLCQSIGNNNINTSTKVESIDKINQNPCLFLITVLKNGKTQHYYTNKVIIATRISTVQKLLPQIQLYKEIHGQPFLYIYAKFDTNSSKIMKQIVSTYTIVNSPLQKMIPFSDSVYMIAYADNKNADLLSSHKTNTANNRTFFARYVERALGLIHNSLNIIAIKDYYWPIGTHYYEPLDDKYKSREDFIRQAQNPMSSMLVVGEAVSRRQGWVEGSLESVKNVLNKRWINAFEC